MALVPSLKLSTLFQDVFIGKRIGESKVSGLAGHHRESMAECDAQPILMTLYKGKRSGMKAATLTLK